MRRRGPKLWYLAAAGAIIALVALALAARDLPITPAGGQQPEIQGASSASNPEDAASSTPNGEFSVAETQGIDEGLQEDKSVYAQDDPDSIVYFYVTVRYGTEERGTNHTFNEVKNAVRYADGAHVDSEVYAEALVQVGDETGPTPGSIGYGETENNATIRIRGNTTSQAVQKSYKLSLNDSAGLWRGQSNIALNKHPYERTRIRNKLYFDLAKNMEHVPSLRTQFARLFIKDETAGATQFEDYGLYTQVEVPTKKYLANHGLDRSGYLYKAIDFSFSPNELIRNFDDPDFDLAAMDTVISPRGREDNTRLLEMIDAVNDTSRDINEVMDTYFDRDNYMEWLAFNILTGNVDTINQNFYLYSPLNGNKFYFIPWDGDGSLSRYEDQAQGGTAVPWMQGIDTYWGITLHQRFLKNDANRAEFTAVVEEMHQWLNKATVDEMAAQLYATVSPYLNQMPDLLYLGSTPGESQDYVNHLGDEVETNYQYFLESIEGLMPFWQDTVETGANTATLRWDDSYDFGGAPITYRLQVSRSPDMADPLVDVSGLESTSYQIPLSSLGEGEFYWKVTASRADGATAGSMEHVTVGDTAYYGVATFSLGSPAQPSPTPAASAAPGGEGM